MVTAQMEATPNHLHMLRDKHVIQLKEATLVGVSVRPAGTMIPFDMCESEAMVKRHIRNGRPPNPVVEHDLVAEAH